MKKSISFLLMSAFVAAAFTACEPLDPQSGNPGEGGDTETPVEPEKPVTPQKHLFTVTLALPEGVASLPDMLVTVTNPEKELEYEKTYPSGTLSMDFEVPSGQYEIIAEGRTNMALSYVASSKSDVFGKQSVELAVSQVRVSPLIFKEVYNTSQKYVLNDTYIEIVNNSNDVQYLDQVIIASIVYPTDGVYAWEEVNASGLYHAYGCVASFPGTGKEYPLQPGESVVIANDATNWKPGAADLSKAPFEVYVSKVSYGAADSDYDAQNMVIVSNENLQRRLGVGFFNGVLLMAKLPDGITPEQFAANEKNFMTEPNSTKTQKHLMIPSDYLLDCVDFKDLKSENHIHMTLAKDDAGYVETDAQSGKAVRRKVTKIVDGRVYYQDTNNSKEDFLNNQPLTPGVHPTEVDK